MNWLKLSLKSTAFARKGNLKRRITSSKETPEKREVFASGGLFFEMMLAFLFRGDGRVKRKILVTSPMARGNERQRELWRLCPREIRAGGEEKELPAREDNFSASSA